MQNRRQSNNYPNDLNKIYMVQGNAADQNAIQYQKRLIAGHSPSNADLGGVSGLPLAGGGGYFHQRNQSMDVAALSGKKP